MAGLKSRGTTDGCGERNINEEQRSGEWNRPPPPSEHASLCKVTGPPLRPEVHLP